MLRWDVNKGISFELNTQIQWSVTLMLEKIVFKNNSKFCICEKGVMLILIHIMCSFLTLFGENYYDQTRISWSKTKKLRL